MFEQYCLSNRLLLFGTNFFTASLLNAKYGEMKVHQTYPFRSIYRLTKKQSFPRDFLQHQQKARGVCIALRGVDFDRKCLTPNQHIPVYISGSKKKNLLTGQSPTLAVR